MSGSSVGGCGISMTQREMQDDGTERQERERIRTGGRVSLAYLAESRSAVGGGGVGGGKVRL